MGTSSTPNKKPPAKKAKGAGGGVGITPSTSKPTSTKKSRAKATKPKKSKAASSSAAATATAGQDPSLLVPSSSLGAAAVASAAGQILCIPTNLPMLIVDNGGWTVKYGLVVPSPTTNNDNTTNAATNTINSGNDNSQTNAINNNNITNPQNEPPMNSTNTKHTTMNTMYNATAQPPQQLTLLAGDEITTRMKNLGQLSWNHPCERGMICDGATQLRVWNRVLQVLGIRAVVPAGAGAGGGGGHVTSSSLLSVVVGGGGKGGGGRIGGKQQRHQQQQQQHAESASLPQNISSGNCAFLLLEPPFVPSVISEGVDRILFRELGMGRVARLMGPCMAAVKYISFGRCSDSNSGGSISSCLFSEEEEKVNDREAVALVKKEIEKRMKKNNATTAVKEEVLPEVVGSDNVNNQLVAGDEARGATEMMNEEKSINKNEGDWINDGTECCCVVDSGYSFTHVVPTHRGGAVVSVKTVLHPVIF